MTTQQINDAAFQFVETNVPLDQMWGWFKAQGGTHDKADYFAVFVKHWRTNRFDLEWSHAYMKMNSD